MPNMVAYGALLAWPIVALVFYLMMPAGRATIWTILAGYLVLPVATSFEFSGVPPLDKTSIPTFAAAILAPLMARHGEFRWPRSVTVNALMLLYVLVPIGTALTNREVLVISTLVLPGYGPYEALSGIASSMIEILPFLLGAALLGHESGHRQMIGVFVLAGVVYTFPILLEVRLSPQLQLWVYNVLEGGGGYFIQQIRGGGFRSMVFIGHGLLVSTFMAMTLMAAIGMARMKMRFFTVSMSMVALWLAFVLVMNKSFGAVVMVALLAPALYFLKPRRFMGLAFVLGAMVVTYPAIRGANILPLQEMANQLSDVAPDRAESLSFRLRNEDLLLTRAQIKPWFGWGAYSRNRVIVENDWGGYSDISVTDGNWIITIGEYGWLGYIGGFGLLTYPFWRLFSLRRHAVQMSSVTLLAVHLINILDLIPNSSLRPITWLVAGALAGLSAPKLRAGLPRRRVSSEAKREPELILEPALQA